MSPKVAVLCQFKDPEAYFSTFHAHHYRLFDRFFYVDHQSTKDYRGFYCEKTTIYRADIKNFTKDIFYARIIEEIKTHSDIDFLFILDIDEFLPFSNRSDFDKFLLNYRNWAVGTLYWQNGFPQNFEELSDCPPLFVQSIPAKTKKLFYNLKLLGSFFPREGNHNAEYSFLGQTWLQARPRRKRSSAGLIHLPLVSKEQISQKTNEFPADYFSAKLGIEVSALILDLTTHEVLNIIGNYRANEFVTYGPSDFEPMVLFSGINEHVRSVDRAIEGLCAAGFTDADELNESQVAFLRRGGFGCKRSLLRLIGIDADKKMSVGGGYES